MMKCATAYLRKGEVFLNSSSKTSVGAWVCTSPYLIVDSHDVEQLGRAVIEVINGSLDGIPHPTEFTSLTKPILEMAGVKSWGAFVKGAHCCEISESNDVITITPTINQGKNGFDHINDKSLNINLSTVKKIGDELIEAFSYCE